MSSNKLLRKSVISQSDVLPAPSFDKCSYKHFARFNPTLIKHRMRKFNRKLLILQVTFLSNFERPHPPVACLSYCSGA